MSVYNVAGVEVAELFSKIGTDLDEAYDKDGAEVYSKSVHPDYDNYSISDMFNKTGSGLSGSAFQAFDIFNGVIAQIRHSSYLCLIDLETQSTINSGMTIQAGHGNSFSFSRVFFSDGDEFPLSYATDGYKYVYVNRVSRTGATHIKTYKFDPTSYGGYLMSAVPTEDCKYLYTMGYTYQDYESDRGGTNLVRIAKWSLENETDNGDGTFIPELIYEKTRDFLVCIQGTQLHDGLLFASCGLTGGTNYVYLIDPENAQIRHTVVLGTTEVEGCAWDENNYLVVGISPSTISYKKVEFAPSSGT